MVGAVVDDGLEAHYGVARQNPLLGRLQDPLLNGLLVLGGDDPARDAPLKAVLGGGLEAEPDVPVLAVPPGLLLVLALALGHPPYGLPVGHLGHGELHLHPVVGEPLLGGGEVELPMAPEEELARLLLALQLEARVLLQKLPQGLAQLGLVRAPLGVDGHGHVGLGEAGEGDLLALGPFPLPKDHAPVEVFRLGKAQDVARLRLLHLEEVLAHGDVEVGQAHGPRLAHQRVPRLQPSPVEADVGHLAHEGVHLHLEDLGQRGAFPEALLWGGEGLQDQVQ